MSTRFRHLFRVMTSTTVLASSMLAAALWVTPAAADTFDAVFIAQLNGAQENPPNSSPSTGVAFLTFNKDNSNLCYAISYTPLAGTEVVAHFHGPTNKGDVAGPGVNSPVRIDISPSPSPFGSPKQGCVVVSDKQHQKDLKKGLWYINVHSLPNFAGGEIRGQVLLQKGIKYKNVPPIATTTTTPTTTSTTTTMGSPSAAFLD